MKYRGMPSARVGILGVTSRRPLQRRYEHRRHSHRHPFSFPRQLFPLASLACQRKAHLVKLGDIDLLKSVAAAKLVDLMVDLVVNPCTIVVHPILAYGVVHQFTLEPIDNLAGRDGAGGEEGLTRSAGGSGRACSACLQPLESRETNGTT
jgi:hypothetical protein